MFFVSSLADSGPGSLRQAITDANNHANSLADPTDTIQFTVAGTISAASDLPAVNDPTGGTVIDGRTAPGFAGAPVVVLHGVASNVTGLTITSANNAVWGLQIDSFATGIDIKGAGATGNVVAGNYIGTDGVAAVGNSTGVLVESGASANVVGGLTAAARNVISGNGTGVAFGPFNTQNNIVEGNYIGTDATGTAAVGNTTYGVYFNLVSNNTVGGTAAGAANVISGNGAGVHIDFGSSGDNVVGNLIGTRADGTSALGNTGNGVEIFITSNNSVCGNTIAFNGGNGVFVSGGSATGNLIRSNSVFSNARLGIDLFSGSDPANGVTANDSGDGDTGPNNLQNYPVLNVASSSVSGGTFVTGSLNGTPGATFTVEFFASAAGDSSGFGEGATPLGQISVTTDAGGNASFATTFATFVPAGQVVTATATGAGNDTSEFSPWIAVVADPTVSVSDATVTESDTGTVTAVFTVTLSATGVRPLTVNFATADGTATAAAGLGGNDYQPTNGTLTFAVGETSKTISVVVNGDTVDEDDETFYVLLSNVMNGTIGGGQGTGTILDNDPPPSASVNDVQVKEGDGGFVSAVFTVTLSEASARQVEISYATADGTAVAPDDYSTTSGLLTFAPGQVTATVSVPVRGDLLHEGDETFTLNLSSPVKATIADGRGVGTIIDDDTPPVAADDSATTDEDTPVTVDVLANDTDADGDTLTVTAATPGTNGSVVVNADNTVTYTPAANFNGTDSFTYTINDGRGFSATATVTVIVNPVNDAPVAVDDTATTDEDTPVTVSVLANDTDVDGDTLAVTAVTQGAQGSVVINADGTVTYMPAANYNGADSFTYTTDDGHGGTATASVSVVINAVNDPPVAERDTVALDEDTSVTVSVLANDSDVDGGAPTVTSVGEAAHGSVLLNADGTVTYTPTPNFNGSDAFTYSITDGQGGTATGTVSITVNPVNDPPAARDDSAVTDEDRDVTFGVLGNDSDIDGDALTVTSVTQGAHGVVVLNSDGTLTYAPAANFNGTDSFTYTIGDGHGGSAGATVTVVVNSVNDPPVGNPDSATTNQDQPVAVSVLANDTDADGDILSVTAAAPGAHGTTAVNANGTVTYTPAAGFFGNDSFTYTVGDGHGGTATASVAVTVNPTTTTNRPPEITASDLTLSATTIDEGGSVTLTGSFRDPDAGQEHTVVIEWGDGSSSTLDLAAGVLSFGPVSHTYQDDDPTGTASDLAPITVTVTDSVGAVGSAGTGVRVNNVAPSVQLGPNRTVAEGSSISLSGNFTDPGALDTFTFHWHVASSNGQVIADGSGQNFGFTPNDNGTYNVTFTVTDDDGGIGQGQVKVCATNVAPTASVTGPDGGVSGQPRTFTFSATDASPVDQQAGFCFFVDWGDGCTRTVRGAGPLSLDHVYKSNGTFTVTVKAKDKDYGVSTLASQTIAIASIALQPDPTDSTKWALAVGGTTANDTISFTPGLAAGQVIARLQTGYDVTVGTFTPTNGGGAQFTVTFNGTTVQSVTVPAAASLARLIAYGQCGDDHISVIRNQSIPLGVSAYIFGGDGNDELDAGGSTANNVIVGGKGQDRLWGGSGRDILIGGKGADQLRGGDGDDILIGEKTAYDANITALTALLSEWGRTDIGYNVRIAHLSGQGGGVDGSYLLTTGTVCSDGVSDDLWGLGGQDWFFARLSGFNADKIKNQDPNEVVTLL